jgi:hypothetical protein
MMSKKTDTYIRSAYATDGCGIPSSTYATNGCAIPSSTYATNGCAIATVQSTRTLEIEY